METNGHKPDAIIVEANTVSEIQQPEAQLETAKKPKQRRQHHNAWTDVNITLDAGARFVKSLVNGLFCHFPSTYRVTESALPLMLMGCFGWNGSNYACGYTAQMVEGSLERASNANKIDKIHIWVLAALTHNTGLLAELKASRKRKNEPARLRLNITMLTLSSALESQIRASLDAIDSFVWEGQEFKVSIKNLTILPEGYGSAVTIARHHPNLFRFHVLDLGGGTLTLTEYIQSAPLRPAPVIQHIANGGGISGVITSVHITLSKSDKSGARIIPDLIQEALRASTDKECMYLFGNKPKNIATSVKSAMDDWLSDNPQVFNILSYALAALLRGEYLYLAGGGFCCQIVAAWLTSWLIKGAAGNGNVEVLPDAYKINLMGIKPPEDGE